MPMRLLILWTEARDYHIRSEIPNDPHDVGKNFVVIPNAHRFVGRFRKPEIERPREELSGVVNAARIDQFFCSNYTESLAQLRPQYILTSVTARNRKISGVV